MFEFHTVVGFETDHLKKITKESFTTTFARPPDCRIPGPLIYIPLNENITIVRYLVLQSTPTHVNRWAGYSAITKVIQVPSLL